MTPQPGGPPESRASPAIAPTELNPRAGVEDDRPSLGAMIGAVALVVALVILIFFAVGYAFGRAFL